MSILRYEFEGDSVYDYEPGDVHEIVCTDGDWCKYKDAAERIDALEDAIEGVIEKITKDPWHYWYTDEIADLKSVLEDKT